MRPRPGTGSRGLDGLGFGFGVWVPAGALPQGKMHAGGMRPARGGEPQEPQGRRVSAWSRMYSVALVLLDSCTKSACLRMVLLNHLETASHTCARWARAQRGAWAHGVGCGRRSVQGVTQRVGACFNSQGDA